MSPITADELKALIEQTYKVEEEYVALRQSYTHLQDTIEQVVEFLPNAIWILEQDGRVFLQNSKAKELIDLLPTLQLESDDYEVVHQGFSYLIKTSHYKDKYLVSATDITEQKRKENLATMGQMAAHLSHEIRNPIGSISLLSSTLMKRVIPENRAIVSEIQKSIYRIERIIKATLLFSKGVKVNIEPIYFKELLEMLHTAIGYYSFAKEIDFEFPQKNFMLKGDIELLSMLFSNLVFNAIDAIELDDSDTGQIRLEHEDDGTFHIFRMYDSGIAIDNSDLLFEAFQSTKEKGNGLGLQLSKQIAQAHGGDVSLLQGDTKIFEVRLRQ